MSRSLSARMPALAEGESHALYMADRYTRLQNRPGMIADIRV